MQGAVSQQLMKIKGVQAIHFRGIVHHDTQGRASNSLAPPPPRGRRCRWPTVLWQLSHLQCSPHGTPACRWQ